MDSRLGLPASKEFPPAGQIPGRDTLDVTWLLLSGHTGVECRTRCCAATHGVTRLPAPGPSTDADQPGAESPCTPGSPNLQSPWLPTVPVTQSARMAVSVSQRPALAFCPSRHSIPKARPHPVTLRTRSLEGPTSPLATRPSGRAPGWQLSCWGWQGCQTRDRASSRM